MVLALPFEVVVGIRKTDAFEALRDELIGLAVAEPDRSTANQGTVYLQWEFATFAEAESVAAAFTMLRERPEIVRLRLMDRENPTASFCFKDTR